MPRLSKIRMQKQFYTKKDFVGIINLLIVWREVVTSRCQGSEPWSGKYGRKKKTKKLTCMTFWCFMVLKNKTVAHTFLRLFDNTNGRLCQKRLLRSTNFAVISPGLVKPAKQPWYPCSGPSMDSMHYRKCVSNFSSTWLIIASLTAVFWMSRNARVTSKKRLRGRLELWRVLKFCTLVGTQNKDFGWLADRLNKRFSVVGNTC